MLPWSGQGLRHATGTPRADDLGGAFLVGRAVDGAIGAGAAAAVGPAANTLGVLRELAAGAVARALELLSVSLGKSEVSGERRVAEGEGAGQDEQGGQVSHWRPPTGRAAPVRLCHNLRAGEAACFVMPLTA